MDSVEFHGNSGDLGRFGRHVLKQTYVLDQPSPVEHRIRWNVGDRVGEGSSTELRSGIRLSTVKLRWADPWTFQTSESPSPLKILLSRGPGPRVTLPDGTSYLLGGGLLQVRRSTQILQNSVEFARGDANFEQLAFELDPGRLTELLGSPSLPELLGKLIGSEAPLEKHEQPLTPALSRLLDEVLNADARGVHRPLFLEAKGLELVAEVLDELALASQAMGTAHCVGHRATGAGAARLEDAPRGTT